MVSAAATLPQTSPAAIVREWDSAYGSGHWQQACHDLTVTLASSFGKGFHASNPYDRCVDGFIGAAHQTPRALRAIQATLTSGKITSTTQTNATAHVVVRYVVSPLVSKTKFPPRETYTLLSQHGQWHISAVS